MVDDVYLTLVERPDAEGRATIRVVIEPLVSWLWVGGAVMAARHRAGPVPRPGRRRPTAPVSAPVPTPARAAAAGDGAAADPTAREPVVPGRPSATPSPTPAAAPAAAPAAGATPVPGRPRAEAGS